MLSVTHDMQMRSMESMDMQISVWRHLGAWAYYYSMINESVLKNA